MVADEKWQQARRHAARGILRSRHHDRIGEAMTYRALAVASAAGQGRKPPEMYIALALQSARARGAAHEVAVTQLCDAEIKLARGERAQAITLLEQAESAFNGMAMTWHLGDARRVRSLFGCG
jgi:hypothetical protein